MKYKIGQKIRIKHNAVEIIIEYNKTANYKLEFHSKYELQNTIQILERLPRDDGTIEIKGFVKNCFPVDAIEPYYDEREIMLELEKEL